MNNFIAFFEIPASDFRRAVTFYEHILKIELSVIEDENEKMACFFEGGEPVGAISYAPGFCPSADGVLIHFNCTNINESLERVLSNNGHIIIPKTKIEAEGKGYFAVFADSEGNHVGLYSLA